MIVTPRFKFLIVGLARDCEKSIERNIKHLMDVVECLGEAHALIIESDSSDRTPYLLERLKRGREGVSFKSLGQLRQKFPKRTDRIAFCRNLYIDEIRNNPKYSQIDYVIVADLDGVNEDLGVDEIRSCWEREDWDVCTANQRKAYYDIWALRHKTWCPGDCWEEYNALVKAGERGFWARRKAVYNKMIEIKPGTSWMEVESAFGGLAIYRKSIIEKAEYVGLTAEGNEVCEHVHLHQKLKEHGARIFINPNMINGGENEHSRVRKFIPSVLRTIRMKLLRAASRLRKQ